MSQVGEVIRFRLQHNRETGQSSGVGVCEYVDSNLVDSAVRNLDGMEYKGHALMIRRYDTRANLNTNKRLKNT